MHILLLKELFKVCVNCVKVILKSNAPFISCISKINGVLVENAEDLDIVMPMYN